MSYFERAKYLLSSSSIPTLSSQTQAKYLARLIYLDSVETAINICSTSLILLLKV